MRWAVAHKTQGENNMKTFRTFAWLMSTAALLGLGGCASYTPKDMLAQFEPGEQKLYVVVPGQPRNLGEVNDVVKNCGNQILKATQSPLVNEWMRQNICSDVTKWQVVAGIYHTKVWGVDGLRSIGAYAPTTLHIERDDMLEMSINYSAAGLQTRPAIVTRIARKAKDATKESGCWWDGGKGATTAFIGGGAVCDGWNWRDQKFAKE
jgi:hypothetical protein